MREEEEYTNVFSWSYTDISGLDTNIILHRLPLMPRYEPIKQS